MLRSVIDWFDSASFMPHGHCFLWRPGILWLHVLSDAAIAAAYFSIPLALFYFVRKKDDLPFRSVFLLFGAFILLCGTTHLLAIWVLWRPDYAAEGVVKALTALASVATFFVTVKLIPEALLLSGPSRLAAVNERLQAANRRLELLNEQIKESGQAQLRAVVDHVPDGIIAVDDQGNIEKFNPACERLFGYASSEAVGRKFGMLMAEPFDVLDLSDGDREAQAKRKDGAVFPVALGVNAFAFGSKRAFVVVVRDVTERKEAEARQERDMKELEIRNQELKDSEERMRAVFDTVMDGLITIDSRVVVQSFNAAAERIFGYAADEVVGRNLNMLMPEPYRSGHDGYVANYLRTGDAKVIGVGREVRARRKDGSVFPMELGVNEFRIGTERAFVGIIRDVTERKKAEARQERDMQELERSNQELDDFAYIASHDLKEPLRGLFNNANFLREDYGDKLDAEGVARLARLGYLCQRMETLVNDLLYFSRLGRQKLAVGRTDLNAMIRDIASMMETTLAEENARIVIPAALPDVVCDKTRIAEVFRNLITNAIKYNVEKEKIIEIGYDPEVRAKTGGGKGAFYVKDNGIGVAPEFHEEIFRIFKRLNEEEDDKKGTGVGLTFVRKIVERHGGHIWPDSALGRGSVFYFTLKQGEDRTEPG
jgi:two-component system sensor kinase FixL